MVERMSTAVPIFPPSRRAKPLPPDERKAAIIAATIPLLMERGRDVTTREIAAACGIAEGTIFRVFADKDELVRAAVAHAMDAAPLRSELDEVDIRLPLDERLLAMTGILQRRLIFVISLMMSVRMGQPPSTEEVKAHAAKRHHRDEELYDAVVRLLEPDADAFRMPVREVARLLRLLTFSGSHRMIADGELLTPEEIVSVLLDGVR